MIEVAIAEALAKYSVDMESGCWNWTGALNQDGYGQISVKDLRVPCGVTTIKAHRIFYVNHVRRLLRNEVIDHLCRNTKCVNPEHLEAVSNADNVRRGLSPRLTTETVKEIRWRYRYEKASQLSLAREYGVSERSVHQAVTGNSWVAGISEPLLSTNNPVGRKSILAASAIAEMLSEVARGEASQNSIAKRYGVSPATVSRLKKEAQRGEA